MKERDRVSFPTDYDQYAPTYAWTRTAVPWVVEPLWRTTSRRPRDTAVLEVGCGTGNYIHALAGRRQDLRYFGFDLSGPMLVQARRRPSAIQFIQGDASRSLPFTERSFGLVFAVDVVHHLADLFRFFEEAHRVLTRDGSLVIVTDSEATFRRRSLSQFFPEILPIELSRYPAVSAMHAAATQAGLRLESHREVEGEIPIDRDLLSRLEAKCSSAMRLLKPEAFAAGMDRVRAAGARDEPWLSCYDVFLYVA